jgi:transposase
MESHEVIKEAFARTSPKAVAADLQVSLSLVYKWAQPSQEDGSGSRNPLDRVRRLMELTGEPKIIQWLCQQAGGHFVRNPDPDRGASYEIETGTNEIVHQFAELLGVITQAAADRTITAPESERIREVWDHLKTVTEGFVRACEDGDFDRARSLARSARPRTPGT